MIYDNFTLSIRTISLVVIQEVPLTLCGKHCGIVSIINVGKQKFKKSQHDQN